MTITLNGTTGITTPALTNEGVLSGTTGTFSGLISANGGQIKFPATQSASTDANTLDDYEEGTFSPTFSATGCTFSYAYQAGAYTKVGRMVTVMMAVALNGSGNTLNGNQIRISNLPFPILVGALYWFSASVGHWYSFSTSVYNIISTANNGTLVDLNKVTAATTGPTALLANDLSPTAGSGIMVSITYQTAS